MPIANYRTEISANKSIGEIQVILADHGAHSIMVSYRDKMPESLSFLIQVRDEELPFRLPANIKGVKAVLEKQGVRREIPYEFALRVGWRILKDWIRAQMAILEAEMVKIDQIFLPYLITKDDQTLYESFVNRGFYLTEGKGE